MNETAHSSGWTPPDWQARRLRVWLDEWELHNILRETNPTSRESPRDRPAPYRQPIVPFEQDVAVGQIRLLPAGALPSACRLLYFAVVADWEDELKLIAPYSRFSEPASTGELLTGKAERQVRVLCLWNAHTLPIQLIAESWVVDSLSEPEVDEAWAVFEHVAFGKQLPMALVERVGPPISHPRDPRIQYQQDEMQLMAPLARRAVQWAKERVPATQDQEAIKPVPVSRLGRLRHGERIQPISEPVRPFHHWTGRTNLPSEYEAVVVSAVDFLPKEADQIALTAGTAPTEFPTHVWRVLECDVRLLVSLHADPTKLTLIVADAVGNPSPVLDGSKLVSLDGVQIAVVRDRMAEVETEKLRGDFILLGASGAALKLTKET